MKNRNLWFWLLVALLLIGAGVILFIGQEPPITRTAQITLRVVAEPGDFTISAPISVDVVAGQDVVFSVDVVPLKGFNRDVAFAIADGPAGMVVSWQTGNVWKPGQPEPDNLACVLAVPLDNGLVGEYTLTLTGTEVKP